MARRGGRGRHERDPPNSPPITQTHEVERLKDLLSAVERGEAFLLQGGDCAETFSGNTEQHIRANTFLLKQLGLALSYGARKPVVKVGRIAGQYAKPRSSDVDGTGNLSYRGDIVNSATPTAAARLPDPRRMIEAYRQSTTTMNVLRALTGTGVPTCTRCTGGPRTGCAVRGPVSGSPG